MSWLLASLGVVAVAGVFLLLARRRSAGSTTADPKAAARAAIRDLGAAQRKQKHGTIRGKGTGADSTFDSSWGVGGGGLS